jgi:hypothetical protein
MILLSFTPLSFSFWIAPAIRASITDLFHRACTMAMRKDEPSYFVSEGTRPLIVLIVVVASMGVYGAAAVASGHTFVSITKFQALFSSYTRPLRILNLLECTSSLRDCNPVQKWPRL